MNPNLHLSDDGEGAGSPSPNPALTPATGAPPEGGALCGGPELRLLMGPVGYVRPTPGADVAVLTIDQGYRWVAEANDWPGCCGPECWHSSPEAASTCFRGEGR